MNEVQESFENFLRKVVTGIMEGWLWAIQGSDIHHFIIDTYNSYHPLPRGYRMTYKDDWCAATVSAAGILAEMSDILPPECSCGEMIRLHRDLGQWVEDDNYLPRPGDLVMYSWNDDGVGDNTRAPNHVGMVVSVNGDAIMVIEGNTGKPSAVRTRRIVRGGRYIRGYCCPNYAKKAAQQGKEEEPGMKLYHYVAEMPSWAQEAATKAVNNGYIKMDETGAANVWESNLQTLVWMDRAGMLDKPAIK